MKVLDGDGASRLLERVKAYAEKKAAEVDLRGGGTVDGILGVYGKLGVMDVLHAYDSLLVTGNCEIYTDLSVNGSASVDGQVRIGSGIPDGLLPPLDLIVGDGGIGVYGQLIAADGIDTTDITAQSVKCRGLSVPFGRVDIGLGPLALSGDMTCGGDAAVMGDLEIYGDVFVPGCLYLLDSANVAHMIKHGDDDYDGFSASTGFAVWNYASGKRVFSVGGLNGDVNIASWMTLENAYGMATMYPADADQLWNLSCFTSDGRAFSVLTVGQDGELRCGRPFIADEFYVGDARFYYDASSGCVRCDKPIVF